MIIRKLRVLVSMVVFIGLSQFALAQNPTKGDYSPETYTASTIGNIIPAAHGSTTKAPCAATSCLTPTSIVLTTLTTQVCATACNDENQTSGPDFVGNNCYDLPNPTVWFSVLTPAGTASLDITVTSAAMTQPTFAVYSSTDCSTFTIYDDNNECYVGAAGTITGNMSVPAMTTMLIGVSAPAGQVGTFQICVTPQPNNSACNVSNSLTVSSTSMGSPLAGPYQPGEVVAFCYTINNFEQDGCNWLQGIVPTFGDCWDASSFTAQGEPVNVTTALTTEGSFYAATGGWDWWPSGSVLYNNVGNPNIPNGTNVGAGWFFSQTIGTDPDNSWGDGNGMGVMGSCEGATSGLSWQVCFTLTATVNCATNPDCSVSFKTFGDGEIGNWTSVGCIADQPTVHTAGIVCCMLTVNAGLDQTICSNGSIALNGSYANNDGATSVAWTASPAGALAGLSSTTSLTPTFTPPVGITGAVTFTLTATDQTCSMIDQVVINVTPLPTATISYAGTPFCTSVVGAQAVTLSGTGAYTGGTYSSTAGLTINAGTGAITPSTSTPGTYTVTYTIPASGGCAAIPVTTSVTITAAPTATISYAGTPFCTSLVGDQAVTLSGTGAYLGGTYSSTAGLTINASTGAITPSTSTPGTYTVTYTVPASGGCPALPVTTSVTITATPTATISYAGTPFCTSVVGAQAVTLSGTGAYLGGTYSSTAGLTINAGTGAITPSTSTPGTYTVTYTVPASGGCPALPVTTSVTITAAPTATISYAGTPFCTSVVGAQAVTLSGTGAYLGGTFSSTAGLTINAANGEITPSTSTPGTYTVTYTIPASGGCPAAPVTTSVTITAAPTATISYAGTPFCTSVVGAQAVTLSGTGAYLGGTYSSTAGLTINAGTGAITPSTSTPGTYTVIYTVPASGGCPALPVTTSVTITAAPTATISYAGTPFCTSVVGAQAVTLSGTGAYLGGTFSSTAGLTINAANGEITPSTSTPGTYTVTYTIPASGGCPAAPVTTSVTITAAPTATISYAGNPFCTSEGVQAVTLSGTGNYTGGTYSSTAGLTINAGTGAITPGTSTVGTYTVTYTIPAGAGCPSTPVTTSVTIDPVPTFTVSGTSPTICNGTDGFITLSGLANNTNYNVTYNDDAVTVGPAIFMSNGAGVITIPNLNAGTYDNIIVAFVGTGCGATDVAGTTLMNPGAPDVFDIANVVICDANYVLPTITGTALTGSESYYTGINGTGTAYPAGTVISSSISPLYIYDANGACTDQENFSITINASPTATISYAGTPFCTTVAGAQSVTLSGTGAYLGGTYSSTAGLTINSGTGAITPSTSTAGTYTVTYSIPASGGCPIVDVTTSITITAPPTATIDYADPFCTTDASAQTVTLNGTNAYLGGTYSSTAGLTINAASGDINASTSTAGTYTVTYTAPASGGCAAVPATTNVTITQGPTASISYAASPYCTTVSGAQAVTLSGTGAYLGGTFASTPGLNLNASTGAIDPSLSTAGTYTVDYTIPASGGCPSASVSNMVTITAVPTASIDYADPFCTTDASAQTVTLNGTNAYLGGTYSSTAGLTINAASGDINASTSTAGTYTVTYTAPASGGCAAVPATTNVTITQGPTASISYIGTPYCTTVSGAQAVTLSGTGAYLGGAFTSTAGLNLNAASGAIDPSLSSAGTYTVDYTIPASGGCPSAVVNTSITITAVPTASIDYADPFCTTDASAQIVTLNGTNAYLGGTYSSTAGLTINAASGDINASTSTAGTYTVTYTAPASGGCAAVPATTNVTITQGPTASISYTGTPYCTTVSGAQAVTLSGTGAYLGGAFTSTAGLNLNAASGAIDPSLSTAGTYTVDYTIPASGGCPSAVVNTSITITAVPTASIDYADPFCTSDASAQSVTLNGTNAYLGGTYTSTAGLTINAASGDINASTSTAGTYTVTYTAPASGGCASVPATTNVTITAAPTASISYPGTPYCMSFVGNDAVTISGTGAYSGGTYSSTAGLIINAASGAITPSTSTAGNYVVTYTIPSSGGCPSTGVTTNVTVNALPTFTLTGTDPTVCNGTDGFVTISGLTASTSYDVTYEDDNAPVASGNYSSDASGNIVISGLNAGMYDNFNVSLTSTGCTGSSASVINLNNPGAPIINDLADQTVCDTYTLPAITGTGLTGNEGYFTGSGGSGTELTVGSAVTSTQTIYIYDINGSCSDEESFVVTVNNTPVITNPGPQVACGSYTLGAITGTNLTGSEAYYNNSQALGGTVISGTISSSQTVWIYDEEGACSDEESFTVTINPLPTVASVTGGGTYCAGDAVSPIMVDVTGSANWSINYTLDGVAQTAVTGSTSPISIGNAPGVYSVMSISDANCSNTATGTQTIVVNPIPAPPTASDDSTYCTSWDFVDVTVSGTGGTYTWYSDAATTNTIGSGASLAPQETAGIFVYYVTETVAGCESAPDSVIITVENCEIIIPSAFTPDGDNVNDDWEIVDLDAVYPNNQVTVYNRWGAMLYQSKKGAYSSDPWDGTYNGEALPVGSYYYIVDFDNDKDDPRKGIVSIILR